MAKYFGIQRAENKGKNRTKPDARPWRARLSCRGITYYLGSYETEEEAADAWDNAAYWLGREGFKYKSLNFPDRYASYREAEAIPQQTDATRKALHFFRMQPKRVSDPGALALFKLFLKWNHRAGKARERAEVELQYFCRTFCVPLIPNPGQPVAVDPSFLIRLKLYLEENKRAGVLAKRADVALQDFCRVTRVRFSPPPDEASPTTSSPAATTPSSPAATAPSSPVPCDSSPITCDKRLIACDERSIACDKRQATSDQ